MKKNAEELLDKYNSGEATKEEKDIVETWYLKYTPQNGGLAPDELREEQHHALNALRFHIDDIKPVRRLWPRVAAAASVLLLLSTALYFYLDKREGTGEVAPPVTAQPNDAAPGGNKAILTLADGSTISLTDAGNGELATQAGITVTKTADGQVVYEVSAVSGQPTAAVTYNTIQTPKGGQYQVNLPDGTKVWLNAASSLKYPVTFAANERRVELNGEGYFEVAKVNAKQSSERVPFIVVSNEQTVEVLGTHFNINSYNDEPVAKTTLIEGSVRVTSGRQLEEGATEGSPAPEQVVLTPGEQAILAGNAIDKQTVNTAEAVAWKNGLFHFENADLKTVMRQIARWYDVEVVYEGKIPETRINGEVYRNMNASKVFEVLGYLNVDFRIEGKKLIVKGKG